MLYEGSLYTEEEWEAAAAADLTMDDDGELKFQGQPPGNTYRIVSLAD